MSMRLWRLLHLYPKKFLLRWLLILLPHWLRQCLLRWLSL